MKCSCAVDIESCAVHDWSQFLEPMPEARRTKSIERKKNLILNNSNRSQRGAFVLMRNFKRGDDYVER